SPSCSCPRSPPSLPSPPTRCSASAMPTHGRARASAAPHPNSSASSSACATSPKLSSTSSSPCSTASSTTDKASPARCLRPSLLQHARALHATGEPNDANTPNAGVRRCVMAWRYPALRLTNPPKKRSADSAEIELLLIGNEDHIQVCVARKQV